MIFSDYSQLNEFNSKFHTLNQCSQKSKNVVCFYFPRDNLVYWE